MEYSVRLWGCTQNAINTKEGYSERFEQKQNREKEREKGGIKPQKALLY